MKQKDEPAKPLPGHPKGDKTNRARGNTPKTARLASQPPTLKIKPNKIETFKDIVATIREPLLVLDKDLRVLSANRSFDKLFKVKTVETVGTLIYELGNRQWDIPALRVLLETILPQKAVFNDYEVEHEFPNLGRRSLLLNARRIPAPPREAQWILLAFEDITVRRQLEQILQDSEERFRGVFDTAHDCMLLVDKTSGKILNSNRAAQDSFGYSKQMLLKKYLWELDVLKDRSQFEQVSVKLEKQGVVEFLNITIHTRQGGDFSADVTMMDRAAVIQCNIRNITAHKQAEEVLAESEFRYRELFENIYSGVAIYEVVGDGADFIFKDFNAAAERIDNEKRKNLIGRSIFEARPGIKEFGLLEVFKRVWKTGKPEHFPVSEYKDEKLTGWYENFVYKLPSGEIVAVFDNATERKRAEEALRENEELMSYIVKHDPNAIAVYDRNLHYVAVSDRYLKDYDVKEQDIIGKHHYEVFPEMPQKWKDVHRRCLAGAIEHNDDDHFERPDGSITYNRWECRPWHLANGEIGGIITYTEVTTERKRMEKTLRASEERHRNILQTAMEGFWLVDTQGRLLQVNDAYCQMSGYSEQELLAMRISDLETIETAVETSTHIQKVLAHGGHRFESRHRRKDGSIMEFEIAAQNLSTESGLFVVFLHDITERKQAEVALEQSYEQLRNLNTYWQDAIEAERTNIAREIHDVFGQSMSALKMDLSWLAKRLPEGDEKIERIHGMNTLVDDSISLIRRIAVELRPGMLDDLGLNAAIGFQAGEFSKRNGIPCMLNLPEQDLGLDPALNTTLFRIFQESLTNISRHANATCVIVSLKMEERNVVLTLQDNGHGITAGELNDPRSLGLMGLRERAFKWGGETIISGSSKKGTTVTVRIPLPASPVNGGDR